MSSDRRKPFPFDEFEPRWQAPVSFNIANDAPCTMISKTTDIAITKRMSPVERERRQFFQWLNIIRLIHETLILNILSSKPIIDPAEKNSELPT